MRWQCNWEWPYIDGILPKGPYPPCLRMADRALSAGYPRHMAITDIPVRQWQRDMLPCVLRIWSAVVNVVNVLITHWSWTFELTFRQVMFKLIKSPQYTGGDFMFLYPFVRRRRRRRRRPQILVHAITFEQLFGFLSFLAQLLALTCRLPEYILVNFRRDLDLDFSRENMEFAISQPKMVRLPRNEKQTYRLNSRAQMWPSSLTLAMTLTLNFQGQI